MNRKSAFTLIELAIVLVIIGLVIGAIGTSNKLIEQAKVKAAKGYSNTSPIWDIYGETGDLSAIVWYDALDEDSITKTSNSVSEWRSQLNLTDNYIGKQSTGTSQPTYEFNGLGLLPAISFDSGDLLTLTSRPIAATDDTYSIGIVFNQETHADGTLFEQSASGGGSAFSVDLTSGGNLTVSLGGAASSGLAYTAGKTNAVIVTINGSAANAYLNSNTANSLTGLSDITISNQVATIGATGGISASLAELVVFDKVLHSEEVTAVMQYFTKKYSID